MHVPVEFKNQKDVRNYRVSNEKMKSNLGFTCKYNLEQIINDIKANDYGDLEKDEYYNIKMFEKVL